MAYNSSLLQYLRTPTPLREPTENDNLAAPFASSKLISSQPLRRPSNRLTFKNNLPRSDAIYLLRIKTFQQNTPSFSAFAACR
ncbi:hypothetical protein PM082_012641 [Marasmius tenuissimus]|nr:hypothetical protein PM082_012641 [Marasmius tenuissimus]